MADANQQMEVEDGGKGKRKAPEPSAGEGLPESGWTAQQVADWLKEKGYEEFFPALVGKTNGEELLGLTKEDLEKYSTLPIKGTFLFNKLHPAVDKPGT